MSQKITATQLSSHTSPPSLWTAINGQVYDLTSYLPVHPGGPSILLQYGGRDASAEYNLVHPPSLLASVLPISKHIGPLITLPPLNSLISTHDFASAAALVFPPKTQAFVTSAATDCITHKRNTTTYSLITLRPRVLVDVSSVSIKTTILGYPVNSPIFVAPTSLGKTVHPEGEKEIGRACKELGVGQVVSTSASFSLGEVLDAVDGHDVGGGGRHPVWFQLYVDKDRRKSEELLREVFFGKHGLGVVFLTVDSPVTGKREADERIRSEDEESVSNPMTGERARNDERGGGLGRITSRFLDASVTWGDVEWLRGLLPKGTTIVIKGVQTVEDARRAVEVGVDGIVVSNHGGRSVDTSPATVLVLVEMRRRCPEVFERLEVLVDGGVVRGTDVFKALCLGARGVGVGRGVLYGLGTYGREGVKRYLGVLGEELETTMRLCGVRGVEECTGNGGLVNTRGVDWLVPGPEGDGEGGGRCKL